MKQTLTVVFALLLSSAAPLVTGADDDSGWSSPVNGLQAR